MTFGAFAPAIRRRVVVTGIGMVTPLGLDAPSTWEAVSRGDSATRHLREVPEFYPSCLQQKKGMSAEEHKARLEQLIAALPCQVAAPVGGPHDHDPGRQEIYRSLGSTAHDQRATQLCLRASAEALRDAALLPATGGADGREALRAHLPPDLTLDRIGVNIGMGVPSLADAADVSHYLFADPERVQYKLVNPLFVPKILGNMAAGTVAIRYGCMGPVASNVAACATGAQCIGEAASWIRQGRVELAVCGGTEACITPLSVAGFSRMRALCSKYNKDPSQASRPFDPAHCGFIMGEGAGMMVLEELEHAVRRGATIRGELRGFAASCDAHHVAAPHPEGMGAKKCIRQAILDAETVPREAIAYVNAHATGTLGDTIELQALTDTILCPNPGGHAGAAERASPLYVSSSKGGLGHLLGAAGGVEAIISLLALQNNAAPPNVNLVAEPLQPKLPDGGGPNCTLNLIGGKQLQPFHGDAVLSTSFGFGGINTALVLTRV